MTSSRRTGHNPAGIFAPAGGNTQVQRYFSAASPASAASASIAPAGLPLTPTAPAILPPMTIGSPPADAMTPGNVINVMVGPPLAINSSNILVGRLNNAADLAFFCETSIEPF